MINAIHWDSKDPICQIHGTADIQSLNVEWDDHIGQVEIPIPLNEKVDRLYFYIHVPIEDQILYYFLVVSIG